MKRHNSWQGISRENGRIPTKKHFFGNKTWPWALWEAEVLVTRLEQDVAIISITLHRG